MRLPFWLPLAACGLIQAQTFHVKGTVLGHDGKPPCMAHVSLLPPEGKGAPQVVATDKDGQFSISTPSQGSLTLRIAAVDHQSVDLPLYLDRDRSVQGRFQLALYHRNKDLRALKVVPFLNREPQEGTPMAKQADGSWRAEVKAPGTELRYELEGIEAGMRTINGTDSARFEYDGDGDYFSILPLKEGKATVVYTPVLPKDTVFTFSLGPGNEDLEGPGRLAQDLQDIQKRNSALAREAFSQGANFFRPPASPEHAARWRQEAARTRAEPHRLKLWTAIILHGGQDDLVEAIKHFPAHSPVLAEHPDMGTILATRLQDPAVREAYLKGLLGHPSPAVGQALVKSLTQVPLMLNRTEEVEKELRRLESLRPGHPAVADLRERLAAKALVAVSKAAPAFDIASLEDPNIRYSNATFKGRFLLIDFWATWCGPCRGELPDLHQAWAKFKGRNLEILSLSFDRKATDIPPFRAGKDTSMPWKHAFVEGGFGSALGKAFAVQGIPRPILIGPDGVILATDGELRGKALDQTLERLLPKS